MSLSKIQESKDLTDAEITEQILAIKRQLMELRMLQATGRLEKPHQFKHAKHRLAQLMTVEGERSRAAAAEALAATKSAS